MNAANTFVFYKHRISFKAKITIFIYLYSEWYAIYHDLFPSLIRIEESDRGFWLDVSVWNQGCQADCALFWPIAA